MAGFLRLSGNQFHIAGPATEKAHIKVSEYFDFSLPSVLWAKRVAKFEVKCSFVCAIIV